MTRAERRAQAVVNARRLSEGHTLEVAGIGTLVPGTLRNLCQRFTRTSLGVGPGYSSAIIAWAHVAKADRHPERNGPPGVPGYFDIGQYGHAVVLDGDGFCWSTDIKRSGQVDRVPITYIEKHWGARWLGWAATINGVRVYGSES